MGGWIGLLVATARTERIQGFVGIAAAPDFTRDLMWEGYDEDIRQTLMTDGVYYEPTEYGDEPYAVSYNLITEADQHLILNRPIQLDCPVRLLHGQKDADVPAHWSERICAALTSNDVVITYVKNGDHRLSSDADLKRLCAAVKELSVLS